LARKLASPLACSSGPSLAYPTVCRLAPSSDNWLVSSSVSQNSSGRQTEFWLVLLASRRHPGRPARGDLCRLARWYGCCLHSWSQSCWRISCTIWQQRWHVRWICRGHARRHPRRWFLDHCRSNTGGCCGTSRRSSNGTIVLQVRVESRNEYFCLCLIRCWLHHFEVDCCGGLFCDRGINVFKFAISNRL